MKRILIISFSPINRDPRVMRQIRLLENSYELIVAGFGEQPDANVEYIEITEPKRDLVRKALKLTFRLFGNYYWGLPQVKEAYDKLSNFRTDLVIANDLSALPLALRLKGNGKVFLDAHEYTPGEFEDRWVWRLFFSRYYDNLCKKYLNQSDAMVTVCQGIADQYYSQYGVSASVVYNAPLKTDYQPSVVDSNQIRLIHHGLAVPSRHLELMIEAVALLDNRFTLDFMLVNSDPAYMRNLRILAEKNQRIRFLPPVPMQDICEVINAYDIGIFLLPPVNFNYKHALPNKFFEFVQARLAVAIGPSPEMARLVNQYACGVVAPSFQPEALANCLNALTAEQLDTMKIASNIAANELNYTQSSKIMLEKIESLLTD